MQVPASSRVQVWASAPWRARAAAWMDEQLAGAGMKRTGEIEQPRIRPWGTVLVAPTERGRVWLKAPAPETAFEVALYELLQRVAPEHVLAPIAADVARSWVLLPDGGPVLGERITGTEIVDALLVVLPEYAQLQRALAPHVDSLLSLGVADMRAEIMPRRFDEALDAAADYVDRRGGKAERATHRRVAALRGVFGAWCEQLAAAPGPPSLDHNDLHPWNVFADGLPGAKAAKFYDWGDSVVAHPFSSMLVIRRVVRHMLDTTYDDPDVLRVRDSYLDVFSDLAPHTELVETMELACRVGIPARALVWDRALRTLGPDDHSEDASAPLETLAWLLDA